MIETVTDLHDVPTKALTQAIRRKIEQLSSDFIFQLKADKKWKKVINCDQLAKLKLSSSLSNTLTEHRTLMTRNVLKSSRAVEIGLLIARMFVEIRELLSTDKELASKLKALARKISSHDQAIVGMIDTIRHLMQVTNASLGLIVFTADISWLKRK